MRSQSPATQAFGRPDTVRGLVLTALFTLPLAGCRKGTPAPTPATVAAPSASAAGEARAPAHLARADEHAEVPTGGFHAGSMPGDPGRHPELEPKLLSIELGAYKIDRLPYPNDPNRPPVSGVTREEAQRLCGERGARLCTELEWERACKGPNDERFPTGDGWDPRCAKEPTRCESGFGTLGMGAARGEWVTSDIAPGTSKALAVVRGAPADAPAEDHRCAARHGVAATTKDPPIGFRCCEGPPNARVLPEPTLGDAYQKVHLGPERLVELLKADPLTRDLAKDVKFFRDPDSAETVISRGPGDRKGFSFTVAPLRWNPVPGADLVVVVGRSGENTSFVVAYHVLADDQYRLAGSFVMKNEPGPVALAYSDDIRPRLHFSTCWGCPGETGKILFRKPERVAIVEP
ncbi:MAG TPA: SUMF1/EgtB/PvdO family nonheme iron enzyme [Polyangiaceae bacterium]|nr:SUMF1/EgtB/PvdO family nonheme iron enzyme [Polyangiaceae bacterium]